MTTTALRVLGAALARLAERQVDYALAFERRYTHPGLLATARARRALAQAEADDIAVEIDRGESGE